MINPNTPADETVFGVWELEMNAAGCTKRTINERRILVRSLGRFLEKPVITASRSDLLRFLAQEQLGPKTKQNYKSQLHTAFTLWQDEGLRSDNPAARLPRGKNVRTEANPLSTAEVQKLLNSGIYGRTRMMILLAAYQGFRAVEIAAVAGQNIDWDTHEIQTVEAKGGFVVWRPLHPAIVEEAQLHPDKFPREGFWFPGRPHTRGGAGRVGQHVGANAVSDLVSRALTRAGIQGHRPHQIRAWHATEMVEAGADMLTVQHSLRHADAATLKHYVRPSMRLIDEGMRSLPALSVPTTSRRMSGVA